MRDVHCFNVVIFQFFCLIILLPRPAKLRHTKFDSEKFVSVVALQASKAACLIHLFLPWFNPRMQQILRSVVVGVKPITIYRNALTLIKIKSNTVSLSVNSLENVNRR